MIRNDIKKPSIEELNSIFLKNRRGIDPEIYYRVGQLNGEIIVWNTNSNELMDYYYDDDENTWFHLIDDSRYLINRLGQVQGPVKMLSKHYDTWGYPIYKISKKHKKIHSLIAKTFIPNINPEINIVIDHIDRDKENYSITNLRWVSIQENANNMYRPNWIGKHKFLAYSDDEIWDKYKSSSSKGKIFNSFRNKTKFDGYYWKIEDLQIKDYLQSINVEIFDDSLWEEHYSKEFLVHPLGLLKFKNSTFPFLGSLNAKGGKHQERRFHHNGKGLRVHILVAEVFLNNNKPINPGLVIDHINTNSLDNRAENLRICSQSENMQNPITKEKLSRKVYAPNGKIYNSISDCAKDYGVTTAAIWARLSGRRPSKGFKYI